ncbi:MAG: NUDIX hydrolase [Pseudomonadota bacterium]|nr:NUDIX hydrolase [Pseudomonadota bacterium]
MVWKPNVTVAAVIEQNGKFLMVEEEQGLSETVFNQPAGHLDEGESIITATIRETLEETAYHFTPSAIVGIYRWIEPISATTFLRVCFTGEVTAHDTHLELDDGIIAAHWLSLGEINQLTPRLRSPLVRRCIDDYLAGRRYPLELLADIGT